MKQFNLKEYLANPNRKVVTREGYPVRIICTDRGSDTHQVVGLVQSYNGNKEIICSFTADGYYFMEPGAPQDLFFAPEKRVRWALFGNTFMGTMLSLTDVFKTKEQAELRRKMNPEFYGSIVRLEWEE